MILKVFYSCKMYKRKEFTFNVSYFFKKLVDPEEEQSTVLTESQQLEIESVKLAESGDYEKSLVLIEKAMQITPNRASLYNNRAQTYRLAGYDSGL